MFGYGIYRLFFAEDMNAIHIAVVGPITGKSSANGKSYLQGINLYLDQLHKAGGVNGRKIVLDVFDDQNDKTLAKEKAQEIAKKNKVLAVIGHNSSSCSIAGGEIYKQSEIPAITPASTNVAVTLNNPWYFRVVFNDSLQGRFIANYTRFVLKQSSIAIIHEEATYGTFLTKVFEETAKDIGISTQHKWIFKNADATQDKKVLEDKLVAIANDVKRQGYKGLILLATSPADGAKLMQLIRDSGLKNQVLAPDSFASQAFRDALAKFPKEEQSPGYYSNDMLVTSPLIFDNANQKAQNFKDKYNSLYEGTPDWRAVYAYDAMMVLVETMKKANIDGSGDLAEDRKKLKEALAATDTISESIEGATGFNYFNEEGDASKPISIGLYRNNEIISSLTQLKELQNTAEVADMEKAIEEEKVYYIDQRHYYKTNVVYTGIEMNQMTNLDMDKLTFNLDFYIWFRYKDKSILPEEIEFLNAIEPIKMENPIDPQLDGDLLYKAYHVKGNFRIDPLPVRSEVGQRAIGVSFRHKTLNRNHLIYVIDVIGMGIGRKVSQKDHTVDKFSKLLSPVYGYNVVNNWFSQDILEKSSLGSPRYLNSDNPQAEYSRYNVGVRIKKEEFTLRRIFPVKLSKFFTWTFILTFLGLGIASKFQRLNKYFSAFWFIRAFSLLMVLLFGEIVLLDHFSDEENQFFTRNITSAIDLLWWIMPAIQINQIIEKFIWVPLEIKTQHKVPTVLRRFVSFLVYLMTFFGIIAFVFDQKITSLLATSGVVAMIIGLAIQVNISNVFSGIAINIERPFRVGDWIKIGQMDEGKVVDITWRTTRVITRNLLILSIPNSKASESPIQNFSMPDNIVEFWFTVHIDPSFNVKTVQKVLLDALYAADGVLKEPAPYTRLNELTDWSADYIIGYCWRDYGKKNSVRKAVWNSIWTHLHRAGIPPALQRNDVYLHRGEKPRGQIATKPETILDEIELFAKFNLEEKKLLCTLMKSKRYPAGYEVIQSGEENYSLYIVVEGVVSLMASVDNGEYVEIGRRGAGTTFNEKAMITGEPGLADIVAITSLWVYELSRNDLMPYLETHPELQETIALPKPVKRESTNPKQQALESDDSRNRKNQWEKIFEAIKKGLNLDT